jgi:C2 domain
LLILLFPVDPYFEVSYYPQGYPAPLKLHRSEVVLKELNPSWIPFQLSTAAINGIDVPFTITCYDWDKDGSHDFIGSLSTTLRELSLGPVLLPLINPVKVGKYVHTTFLLQN